MNKRMVNVDERCSTIPLSLSLSLSLALVWADSHRDTVGGGGVDWRGDSPDVWSCGHHSQSPERHHTHPCPPPLQVR